jgi:hypothetical protein
MRSGLLAGALKYFSVLKGFTAVKPFFVSALVNPH